MKYIFELELTNIERVHAVGMATDNRVMPVRGRAVRVVNSNIPVFGTFNYFVHKSVTVPNAFGVSVKTKEPQWTISAAETGWCVISPLGFSSQETAVQMAQDEVPVRLSIFKTPKDILDWVTPRMEAWKEEKKTGLYTKKHLKA